MSSLSITSEGPSMVVLISVMKHPLSYDNFLRTLRHPLRMIYHITTEKEWAVYEDKSEYAPAAFEKEGFIHASRLSQLEGVLQRYYSGRNDLLLLRIDERKLECDLIYEPSANKELFPHVYGKVNKEAIVEIVEEFDLEKLSQLIS